MPSLFQNFYPILVILRFKRSQNHLLEYLLVLYFIAGNQEKSLETVYDDSKKALTIRKPGFNVAKQWSIKLA